MRVIVLSSAAKVYQRAAEVIAAQVRRQPSCVLGLATGGTMEGVYQELVRLHGEQGLDFARVVTFNLDEYVGLAASHPRSYRYFMQQHLFGHINLQPTNIHVPDGRALDLAAHCEQYEQRIQACGGIDLQLLGVGSDGHIAFNEPGSSLGSRTRIKTLTRETVADNARFFAPNEEVPRQAITMGVGTILDSRRCLLLATGTRKAEAIRAMIEGPVTAQVTASALQLHREVVVILDEEAAVRLQRREYYDEVERAQEAIEQQTLMRQALIGKPAASDASS